MYNSLTFGSKSNSIWPPQLSKFKEHTNNNFVNFTNIGLQFGAIVAKIHSQHVQVTDLYLKLNA